MKECFRGCLLGLAVGDGLGARFEGWRVEDVARFYLEPRDLMERLPSEGLVPLESGPGLDGEMAMMVEVMRDEPRLVYTDDTQMAIGVAEALIAEELPDETAYAARFVANYEAWRGYGRGARVVMECLEQGMPPAEAATFYFADGSYGNGAAMRVAPVGLRFAGEPAHLIAQAREQALPTHRHPLGIEGAVLLARGVGFALETRALAFDRDAFFTLLEPLAEQAEMTAQLRTARGTRTRGELLALGSEIVAQRSIPTALACFATHPDSFLDAVGTAVLLGGDADTVAAMTGALSGARLGEAAIPRRWLLALENETQGRAFLRTLADRLARLVS